MDRSLRFLPLHPRRPPRATRSSILALALVLTALAGGGDAAAQDWLYPVRPGDHLWGLAERFLDGHSAYGKLQQLNRIRDPKRLPPGSVLRIPLAWMRRLAAEARLTSVRGAVEIERAGGAPVSANVGDALRENDRLRTSPGANAALALPDGTQVRVLSDTELTVESMATYANARVFDSRLLLARGRTETIAPTDRDGATRFELRTRAGVTSVRGTVFRVAASPSGDETHTEVLRGRVAAANTAGEVSVDAGYGTVMTPDRPPAPPVALLKAPNLDGIPATLAHMPVRIDFPPVNEAVGYRIQVAANTEFSSLLVDVATATPTTELPDLADGTYALRIRGVDARGLEGADAVREVRIAARPPAPLLQAPAADALVDATPPTFRWTPDGPADRLRYRFQLARDAAFTNIATDVADLTSPEFTAPAALEAGLWHWRVAAVHEVRGEGPFGEVRRLRRPAPAPGAATIVRTPQAVVARWSEGKVHAQLVADEHPDAPVADALVDSGQWSATRPAPGRYRLVARTVEADGFEGPDATAQTIVIPPPPRPPTTVPLGAMLDAAPSALVWAAPSDDDRPRTYRMQLESVPADRGTTMDRAGLETSSISPGPLAPGLYRWRVAAATIEDGPGDFGPWNTFRVLSPPPPQPTISRSPTTLAIRWSGTTTVHARLVGDDGQAIFDGPVTGGAIDLPRPGPGRYVLAARTVEPDGFEGPAATSQAIVVPPVPLPPTPMPLVAGDATHATLDAAPAALAWKAPADDHPRTYRMQLENVPADPVTTVDRDGLEALSISPGTLAPGLYRWRVATATVEDGLGDFGPWNSFRVLSPPPDMPTITRTPETLSIRWSRSAAVQARLIGDDARVLFAGPVTDGAIDLPRPRPGRYVLTANTLESDGFVGRGTAEMMLELPATPAAPRLATTAPGGVVPAKPELRWAVSVPGATYRLQVARDAAFSAMVIDQSTGNATAFVPTRELPPGSYRWRVSSATERDGVGPFSAPAAFRVEVPAPVLAPVTAVRGKVSTSWNIGVPATTYEVELARDAAFSSPVTTERTTATNATFAAPAPGRYFARVRGFDPDGVPGPYSAVAPVRIPASLPWWTYFLLPFGIVP